MLDGDSVKKILNPTPHLVAYIDLLGIKEKICSDDSEKNLNNIDDLYDIAFNHMSNKEFLKSMPGFRIKSFSDNFIISLPLTDSFERNMDLFISLSNYLSSFQLIFLLYEIVLRGGITIGNLFINDRIVWGEALIRGYKLENEIAVFPRIVIDTDNDTIKRFFDYADDVIFPELYHTDKDGNAFINCFTKKSLGIIRFAPVKHKKSIDTIISENINNPRLENNAKSKWIWTYNQYQSCEDFSKYSGDD